MSTEPQNDLELFQQFLTAELQTGVTNITPEESVKAFRQYQSDLARFRRDIQPAIERFERGEGRELDYEALKSQVSKDLADKGITE